VCSLLHDGHGADKQTTNHVSHMISAGRDQNNIRLMHSDGVCVGVLLAHEASRPAVARARVDVHVPDIVHCEADEAHTRGGQR